MLHLQGPCAGQAALHGILHGLTALSWILLWVCPFGKRFVSFRGHVQALLPNLPWHVQPDSFPGAAETPQCPHSHPGHRGRVSPILPLWMLCSQED